MVEMDAALPPVGGLGNFKGVMLCNRPVEADPSSKAGPDGAGPFRSTIAATHNEQLGLTPCKNFEPSLVKTRGPSAALRRHVRWLKELQDQMQGERQEVVDDADRAEERRKKMKDFFHKQREGVRGMLEEREAARKAEGGALTEANLAAKAKKAPPAKPLWAMTEKQKDEFEEEEADDLINFVEGLDYEKYVGDLEFRQGMQAVADRAGKLQREQDAFKDALVRDFNAAVEDEGSTSVGSPRQLEDGLDGRSILGDLCSEYSVGSRRSRGDERYGREGQAGDWDSSTNCDERERHHVNRDTKEIAAEMLEDKQIRAIHSKDSMQRIVEKTRALAAKQPSEPMDLMEAMRRDGEAVCPVITTSADTQNRLHKPPDPSKLPYLYRSPAV